MRHLAREFHLLEEPEAARLRLTAAVAHLPRVTVLRAAGDQLEITEEWRPLWTFVVAFLLFPVGLLALLIKNKAVLNVSVVKWESGVRVRVNGRAHEAVCDLVLGILSPAP